MINLLPPEQKAQLQLEKKKKLVVILAITLLVPLACASLLLLSIRFYLLGEVGVQNALLQEAKQKYQTPDFLQFSSLIQNQNVLMIQLENFYSKEININSALKVIASTDLPKNLYITNLSLSKDQDQHINVIASGVSALRDDLLVFQKNIQQNNRIENVVFSPESWVSPKNPTFYVTLQIMPKAKDEKTPPK